MKDFIQFRNRKSSGSNDSGVEMSRKGYIVTYTMYLRLEYGGMKRARDCYHQDYETSGGAEIV